MAFYDIFQHPLYSDRWNFRSCGAGLCSPLGHSFSRMMSDLRQEQRQQYVMMIFMNTL